MGATQVWGSAPIPFPIDSHAYGGIRMGNDPATSVVDWCSIAHESTTSPRVGGSTFGNTTG